MHRIVTFLRRCFMPRRSAATPAYTVETVWAAFCTASDRQYDIERRAGHDERVGMCAVSTAVHDCEGIDRNQPPDAYLRAMILSLLDGTLHYRDGRGEYIDGSSTIGAVLYAMLAVAKGLDPALGSMLERRVENALAKRRARLGKAFGGR